MTVVAPRSQSTYSREVPKPWGSEVVFTPPDLPYAGKLLNVSAGRRLSLQIHDQKMETLPLLSGQALFTLEDDGGAMVDHEMTYGIGYAVAGGRKHRLAAITDCVVLEASTPEIGMAFGIADDYGRAHETLD